MCGIIGVAGDLTGKEENLFKDLLIINTLRGKDSTGIAAIGGDRSVKVVKTVGDPFQLYDTTGFTEVMRRKNHVLIGHNRAATTGKVVRKNAHPFEFHSLVGVHNGTLHSKHTIPGHEVFDTDSEALYNHIDKVGIDEAIKEVKGAYALVWYDKDEDTINFLRNKERPMNLVLSEDKKHLFFASETWMLTCVLGRDRYKHLQAEELPEDNLFSFKIPKAGEAFEKARVRAVKPRPFTSHLSVLHPFQSGTSNLNIGINKKKETNLLDVGEILKKSSPQQPSQDNDANARALKLKSGDVVGGLDATHYSKNSFGAFFVSFKSERFPGIKFRCYFKDAETCSKIVAFEGTYVSTVSFVGYLDNASLEVKVTPNELIEEAPEIPAIKVDHRGLPIEKDEFDKRYGSCLWCLSPVLYEEDYLPLTSDTCLCEGCGSDPEVKQYIPDLKNGV